MLASRGASTKGLITNIYFRSVSKKKLWYFEARDKEKYEYKYEKSVQIFANFNIFVLKQRLFCASISFLIEHFPETNYQLYLRHSHIQHRSLEELASCTLWSAHKLSQTFQFSQSPSPYS